MKLSEVYKAMVVVRPVRDGMPSFTIHYCKPGKKGVTSVNTFCTSMDSAYEELCVFWNQYCEENKVPLDSISSVVLYGEAEHVNIDTAVIKKQPLTEKVDKIDAENLRRQKMSNSNETNKDLKYQAPVMELKEDSSHCKMRTQREYMEAIKNEFIVNIKLFTDILNAYSYRDKRACDRINRFKENVKKYGLKFSNCHHANGIGNNNDYMIYVEAQDAEGFVIQKNVANFYYCYGIHGGCYVMLKDLATGEKFVVGRAR